MRLVVFQHVDCEHPGVLRRFLAADGIGWDVVQLDQGQPIPPLETYDQLWVMGGPHGRLGRRRASLAGPGEDRDPALGPGAETPLPRHLPGPSAPGRRTGRHLRPATPPEVGILEIELTAAGRADPLFAGLPERQPCLQWHSVRVGQPPEDAVVLASSPVCRCQALRIGRNAYGLQYHVELEPETIPTWASIPAYEAALAATQGDGALGRLEAAATPLMPQFVASAERLYRNFMTLARA